jgi:hypothetical protein
MLEDEFNFRPHWPTVGINIDIGKREVTGENLI